MPATHYTWSLRLTVSVSVGIDRRKCVFGGSLEHDILVRRAAPVRKSNILSTRVLSVP